ncbi:hypothetical protein [Microbispora rosea]|uniref:hypothetical protein n=1 Tax=Microbispora rosea TaxID=58117 RepID=UPI003D916720
MVAEIAGAVAGEAWETAFRGLSGAGSGSALWLMSAPAYVPCVLGALVAVLLHRRIGTFRLAWWALIVSGPFTLLLALSGIGPGWAWYVLGTAVPLLRTRRSADHDVNGGLGDDRARRVMGRTGDQADRPTTMLTGVPSSRDSP